MHLLLLVYLVLAPAIAAAFGSGPTAACSIGAFVTERRSLGLNVRAEPDAAARVVGRLPPMLPSRSLDGYLAKVEVRVHASKNGWMLVSDAQDNEALSGIAGRSMFRGRGWVSGRGLGVKSQADTGYARPDSTSAIVFRLSEDGSLDGDEMVESGQLIGCSGRWALVEYDENRFGKGSRSVMQIESRAREGLRRGRFRVWVNQICDVQETSCDGLGGDAEPQQPR